MVIVLRPEHSASERVALVELIEKTGARVRIVETGSRAMLILVGDTHAVDAEAIEAIPAVEKVLLVEDQFKLSSRGTKPTDTVVRLPGAGLEIGGRALVVIAGPCAVESERQTLSIARRVRAAGARVLRGGAYKPRTSPYDFQGIGRDGLRILAAARAETGLAVVTEAVDQRCLEDVAEVADIIQIGARNMMNFGLLRDAGQLNKPVMVKRGLAATVNEWLLAAEYVLAEGNPDVILCERGIRTFGSGTRNTLDLAAVSLTKRLSHLPIIVDPSHATGLRAIVPAMACAAVAAGADGVMVEVCDALDQTMCDGPQGLPSAQLAPLVARLDAIREIMTTEPPAPRPPQALMDQE